MLGSRLAVAPRSDTDSALVHQFLSPGSQVGSRIKSDLISGAIEHVHTAIRGVLPDVGGLLCDQQINAARLHEESISGVMRKRQKCTDDPTVVAPSVITLNATTAAQAANDFLFYVTGSCEERIRLVDASPRLVDDDRDHEQQVDPEEAED